MTQTSESQTRQTAVMPPVSQPVLKPEPVHSTSTFTDTAVPWRLLLDISESGNSLRLEIVDQVLIGRADLPDNHIPGLDLGPYGGQDYGVSRKHATLFIEEGSLYLRDLASTNGTRINGYALEPDKSYKLVEGDEIEFGQLRVVLRISHSTAQ